MSCLTPEQLEDLIRNSGPEPPHLQECADCRARLAEARALADRLQGAFASLGPDQALADAIRRQIQSSAGAERDSKSTTLPLPAPHRRRRLWPAWAAAAALFVVLIPLGYYFSLPPAVAAAQEQLVRIHRQNLSPGSEFFADADPEKLAAYFHEKLGFSPAFPDAARGLSLRGCCVAHFRDQVVGSYVVDTPQGIISIIVVHDPPESLGMTGRFKLNGDDFWKSTFAHNYLVVSSLNNYTYCAVADQDTSTPDYLARLLHQLIHPAE